MADLHLDLNQSLDMRIAQFKNDPDKMKDVNDFLNELLEKAKKEAEKRSCKQKGKLMEPRKLEHGPTGLAHPPGRLLQGFLLLCATALTRLRLL